MSNVTYREPLLGPDPQTGCGAADAWPRRWGSDRKSPRKHKQLETMFSNKSSCPLKARRNSDFSQQLVFKLFMFMWICPALGVQTPRGAQRAVTPTQRRPVTPTQRPVTPTQRRAVIGKGQNGVNTDGVRTYFSPIRQNS